MERSVTADYVSIAAHLVVSGLEVSDLCLELGQVLAHLTYEHVHEHHQPVSNRVSGPRAQGPGDRGRGKAGPAHLCETRVPGLELRLCSLDLLTHLRQLHRDVLLQEHSSASKGRSGYLLEDNKQPRDVPLPAAPSSSPCSPLPVPSCRRPAAGRASRRRVMHARARR